MIRQNIIANFIGRAWGVISVYLFIPLYLKFLGIEAFGLVGFYSILLSILMFADMGFSATLKREMARLSVRKDSAKEMKDVLRTYESAYAIISILLSILIWFLAPLIAEYWLHSKTLQVYEITAAIRLMGISVALQLPSGLYIGGLMGLQKQLLTNSLQIACSVFRGVGTVFVLWLYSPTIFAFALWQLISNAVYCFAVRWSLWRVLSYSTIQPRITWKVFQNTWHYAAGMVGMAAISTILTQTDKLVVSKVLSLEMLGYYTLAGTLASAPLMLASPIANAVFPRLTGLVAIEDRNGLTRLYHRSCELVAIAIIPAGLTLAMFSHNFIFAWTGSAIIAHRAGMVASLLLGGQLMQALMVVPYYLALAHGYIRLNLQIGIASVVLIIPLLIFLIMKFGIVGAGISWLVMNLCTLLPYMYFLHRRFLHGELQRWWLRDVGRPLLAVVPWVLLGRWLLPHTSSRVLTICLIGIVWALSAISSALTIPALRKSIIQKTRNLLGVSYGT